MIYRSQKSSAQGDGVYTVGGAPEVLQSNVHPNSSYLKLNAWRINGHEVQ